MALIDEINDSLGISKDLNESLGMSTEQVEQLTESFVDLSEEMNSLGNKLEKQLLTSSKDLKSLNLDFGLQNQLLAVKNDLTVQNTSDIKFQLDIIKIQKDVQDSLIDGSFTHFNAEQQILELKQRHQKIDQESLTDAYQSLKLIQDQTQQFGQLNNQGKTLAETLKETRDRLQDNENSVTSITKKITEWKDNLLAIASDPKLAMSIFAGVVLKNAGEFLTTFEDVRKQIGTGGEGMIKLSSTIGMATINGIGLGISLKDAGEATAAIVQEAGNLNNLSSETVTEVARLSSWYGVSAGEGAKLAKITREVNNNSNQASLNTLKYAENLATASGVPVAKLMSDVAGDTELFALYSKNGGKNIFDAAASANKLGVSMSEIKSIATKLTDVTGSIESEMEASVLLGRQINLQRARELAFAGDLEGMQKEVISQLGSINEWDKLNVIQKQALAESVGVGVDQLQTMIANQDELNRKNGEGSTWIGRQYMGMQGLVKSAWEYKDVLGSGLHVLSSMKNVFPNLAKGISNVVSTGISKFKGLAKVQQMASKGQEIQKQAETVSKAGGAVAKGNPLVNWINSWKQLDLKALLMFGLAIGMLILTIPLLALALKQFNGVEWESALMGMTSLLGLALIMKLIGNQTSGMVQGALALLIMGAALIPFTFALSLLSGIKPDVIMTAMGLLLGLTLAVIALGLIFAGPQAAVLALGVLAIIALGGAMIVLGLGINVLATGLNKLTPMMSGLISQSAGFSEVGTGFISMGIGIAMFSASLLSLVGTIPILILLAGALTLVSMAVNSIVSNFSVLSDTILPAISSLIQLVPQMYGLSTGLAAISTGLITLSGSLLTISPLIPLLGAIETFTANVSANIGGNETMSNKSEKNDKLVEKIDTLISILTAGGAVTIDGRQIGKWMGLKMDSMNIHNI